MDNVCGLVYIFTSVYEGVIIIISIKEIVVLESIILLYYAGPTKSQRILIVRTMPNPLSRVFITEPNFNKGSLHNP